MKSLFFMLYPKENAVFFHIGNMKKMGVMLKEKSFNIRWKLLRWNVKKTVEKFLLMLKIRIYTICNDNFLQNNADYFFHKTFHILLKTQN